MPFNNTNVSLVKKNNNNTNVRIKTFDLIPIMVSLVVTLELSEYCRTSMMCWEDLSCDLVVDCSVRFKSLNEIKTQGSLIQ